MSRSSFGSEAVCFTYATSFRRWGCWRPHRSVGLPGAPLEVDNVDAVFERALATGANGRQPPADMFWVTARAAEDPFGHRWNVSQHLRDVPHDEVVAAAARCSVTRATACSVVRGCASRSCASPGACGTGVLTGKYANGTAAGADGRLARPDVGGHILSQRNHRIAETVSVIAAELAAMPAQVALAWLPSRPGVVLPIVGARKETEVRENLAAVGLRLDPEHLARLETATGSTLDFRTSSSTARATRASCSGTRSDSSTITATTYPAADPQTCSTRPEPTRAGARLMPTNTTLASRARPDQTGLSAERGSL